MLLNNSGVDHNESQKASENLDDDLWSDVLGNDS